MTAKLNDHALDVLFHAARSHNGWKQEPVSDAELHELYELIKWGPTMSNSQPGRFLFLRSQAAKERLKPALNPGNVEKSMTAPVLAILAYDLKFYENFPRTFPHRPEMGKPFAENPERARIAAFRNGSLQGGYFIMAARALGIDCGPMSGFDNAKVDAEFFPDGRWKSNFLCALGQGDHSKIFQRNPRLPFEEVCKIV
jgi:3-hydroxypropanoate dehydrogenase